jgi:S-DNA-T family DNA segregation ATPase FtsK/SpoIIIE
MMAKETAARKWAKKKKKELPPGPLLRPEITGTLLLIISGLTLLALFIPDQSQLTAFWIQLLSFSIGWTHYIIWLLLGGLAVWYIQRYGEENEDEKWEKPVGVTLLVVQMLVLFHLVWPGNGLMEPGGGGGIGWILGETLRALLGTGGTLVLLAGLMPLVVILISGLSLRTVFGLLRDLYYRFQDWRHFRQLTRQVAPLRPALPKPQDNFVRRLFAIGAKQNDRGGDEAGPTISVVTSPPARQIAPPASETIVDPEDGAPTWRLPPIAQIFEEGVEQEISEAEIRQRVKMIEETLLSFGVEVKVREINQGPAVTQFSLEPGYMATKDSQGNPRKVRVSRIVALSNDLALALAASPIRIEAPIPGRPYVGLEVPNSSTNIVTLRGLMETERFQLGRGNLKLALGQDVSGRAVIADLTTMPHLLIAGATGSGKSVCINAIVACLISTHTPETLRLLMVDPKMVELVNYNGIPHLLAPVVTEVERVVGILNWATREMDRRYKLFAKEEVRHVVAYNQKMIKGGQEMMPYIVLIIDELADLMMVAPDEVEQAITRIAQMARATGIHLIIATQRPSVNVVTGLIKANFPARIAFAVTSQIDSRVILDTPGAERLLGKGDMLYMGSDSAKLQRLQGVYLSDQELNRLTAFWRGPVVPTPISRGPVEVSGEAVQQPLWGDYQALADNQPDDLLEKAIAIVREQGKASVSLLQRRLRVGYNRAARLIDEMEEQGIIGPDEGTGRARPVLVTQADDAADPTAEEE